MENELTLNWTSFEGALARRAATSTRDHLALAVEQMRGIMREVVKVTPPGYKGFPGGTKEAQQHGQAKAAADVRSLYGTPNAAFDRIKAVDTQAADSFWWMRKHQKEEEARQLFREKTGEWYGPFDGGKIHGTHYRRGKLSRRRGRPIIYISNPEELEAYVSEVQGKVMNLTAGWKQAFAKLGISLPQFVTKHDAPGSMHVEISDTRIRFIAADEVVYAAATGLQRRIQFAINRQTGKMNRQWEDYTKRLNAKAGL